MLTFAERVKLSQAEVTLAELELSVAIERAHQERQDRIEAGWNNLIVAIFDADPAELEWR